MTDYPLLILPTASIEPRHKGRSGFSNISFPKPDRQKQRLTPQLKRLEEAFQHAQLQSSPIGIEPEKALVFEIAGTIQDFSRAVARIEGLEWLSESLGELPPDEDFFLVKKPEKPLNTQLYLVMSNLEGARKLLSLWNRYRAAPGKPDFPWGQGKWKNLFQQLIDLRFWGPKDRFEETGLREEWEERKEFAEETIRIEIELWYRKHPKQREQAEKEIHRILEESSGRIISRSLIEGIQYHALLADLPIGLFDTIFKQLDAQIVRCDQVMFLRPRGQMTTIPLVAEGSLEESIEPLDQIPPGEPVIALLDGLPLENHALLRNRLLVDDPDDWAESYEQSARNHGTAMASLILHGDRSIESPPLSRPLYCRPVLLPQPTAEGSVEESPTDQLLPDLILRAIRRIVEGEDGTPAVAPNVRVINLSLGDPTRPFFRNPSPWARLLDYLADTYQLLFIVSAGNHPELRLPMSPDELKALTSEERAQQLFPALRQQLHERRLLSPAESINALTVGAIHSDAATFQPGPYEIEILPASPSLPAPYSALGSGVVRGLKPDLLFSGGRQAYRLPYNNQIPCELRPQPPRSHPPGHRVACPNPQSSAELANTLRFSCGTSNATALMTRQAAHLMDLVEELREQPGGEALTDDFLAVVTKALLAHGASWADLEESLRNYLPEDAKKEDFGRFLGYGLPKIERVLACTEQRATLLGCGEILNDEGHLYAVPLPPSLSGQKLERRVTVTLAWLSPINPQHQRYRQAALEVALYGDTETKKQDNIQSKLRLGRKENDYHMVRRGTLQHMIFSGEKAAGFGDEEKLFFQVNCRAIAGKLTKPIRYALAISLEVPEEVSVPIYQEIRERIRPQVRIRPAIG